MISHTHKFILITPAKTGSVSICDFFLKYTNATKRDSKAIDCFDVDDPEFGEGVKHIDAKNFYNKNERLELNYDLKDYTVIGATRNPWDRALSHYFWAHQCKKRWEFTDEGFCDFLLNESRFNNCVYAFTNYANEFIVDDFIRFENMQHDVDAICDKLGLVKGELPHRNGTTHEPYWTYYSDNAKDIIAEKYKGDIEYFGYEFGK